MQAANDRVSSGPGPDGSETSITTPSSATAVIAHEDVPLHPSPTSRRLGVGQEELDDRHRDLGSTYRQGECQSAERLTTNSRGLGADRRVDHTEADLRGVVEQLRVLDLPGEIGGGKMLQRPLA